MSHLPIASFRGQCSVSFGLSWACSSNCSRHCAVPHARHSEPPLSTLPIHTRPPWLTDRTHTLYPSGYFCVLKSKPLLSFLSLFGGGDSGLRVGLAAQIDTRNQFVAAT